MNLANDTVEIPKWMKINVDVVLEGDIARDVFTVFQLLESKGMEQKEILAFLISSGAKRELEKIGRIWEAVESGKFKAPKFTPPSP